MVHILYATNRQQAAGAAIAFTDVAAALCYGTADIVGIDIASPASGTVAALPKPATDAFSAADLAPLLASQNDILVFVHGAANSFTDAITRAAYNKTWLGAANVPGVSAVCDVIAFSWPARPYVLANIVGDFIDYRHDQTEAATSTAAFGTFLQQIVALRPRIGKRRINLLCHSMGNYMLAGATEQIFANAGAPASPLFDRIILAAADEIATSFSTPHGGRLANLARLGRQVTVYFDNDDIAMALSHIANGNFRLGYAGPPNAADTNFFPTGVYDFVDCTGVNDYLSSRFESPDRSHQYYRQSPTVRADIVAVLAGAVPARFGFNAAGNIASLFPPPMMVASVPGGPGNSG